MVELTREGDWREDRGESCWNGTLDSGLWTFGPRPPGDGEKYQVEVESLLEVAR